MVTKNGRNLKSTRFSKSLDANYIEVHRYFLHRIDFEIRTMKRVIFFSVLGGKAEKQQNEGGHSENVRQTKKNVFFDPPQSVLDF